MSPEIVQDILRRLSTLERSAVRDQPALPLRPDGTIQVKNATASELTRGQWVVVSSIDATSGLTAVDEPGGDSALGVVGVVVESIAASKIGLVQVSGVVDALVDSTESPSAGDELGVVSGSFAASSGQTGAGIFLHWAESSIGLARVKLTPLVTGIVVDHDHGDGSSWPPTGDSTQITERDAGGAGVDWQGYSHDLLKVIAPAQNGKPAATRKAALSAAQSAGHNEGWVWADEIAATTPGGQFGWGRIWDLAGVEATGLSVLNWKTQGRWNDGGGSVGPIDFNGGLPASPGTGPWIYGSMVYAQGKWHPAIQCETTYPRGCTPASPAVFTLDCDCNCLADPQAYQMQVNQVIGPYRASDSLDNYIEVLCCVLDRQNLIFRLLHYLDCCVGNQHQRWNDWLKTNLNNAGGSDIVTVLACCVAAINTYHGVNCAPSGISTWGDQCPPNDAPYEEPNYKTGKCDRITGE